MDNNITQRNITDEDIQKAEEIEMDVQTMLRLVDLIFLCKDDHNDIPS